VKRLLFAAAMALAFHSLLFTVRFERPKAKLTLPLRALTLSLAQGPSEPPPSLAVSKIPEPPDPLPYRPRVQEEQPHPQNTRKPEKSFKKIEPSVPPQQEQASNSTGSSGLGSEKSAASGASQDSPLPAHASPGRGGPELPTIPVHEATPLYRQNPIPVYPMIARKRGFQGIVILEVLVDRQGKVADLRLSSSSGHPVLDQAALTSVKTWLFDPGTRGREKIDMWVKVPVRFRLE